MKLFYTLSVLLLLSCADSKIKPERLTDNVQDTEKITHPAILILGTVQDAGSPHIACKKECCKLLFTDPDPTRKVVSLGLVDPEHNKTFLIDATPDIGVQLKVLKNRATAVKELPDGIFLTHAHIGHYSGLMYLGKEATNADSVAVYAMDGMKAFLEQNGPWGQLVSNGNILLHPIKSGKTVYLTPNISVTPFKVPHRDEYSETVGYKINGPSKSALFIPDIDKWEKWEEDIVREISNVDFAFLDASFYDAEEINNRDITEIPHPFVIESMKLFKHLSRSEKSKIHFIHFNHTNPLLNPQSKQTNEVLSKGFRIARFQDVYNL